MKLIALIAGAMLAGCTYTAQVAPTAAPAAEIIPERKSNLAISYYVSPELQALTRDASEGYMCSAHKFPVNAGPAIASSIRSVNEAGFASATSGGDASQPADGVDRHLVFQLDQFTPRVHFDQGWWSATAIANTELAMRVVAYDAAGKEVLRVMIAGSGYGEIDGGCDAGAKALETATNQAIKRAMENYVSRVINAQQI